MSEPTTIQKFREALERGSAGAFSLLAALERELSDLRQKADEAMRGLESLTPGGSEFVGDVATCVRYVKDARTYQLDQTKRFVLKNRELTRERDEARLAEGLLEEIPRGERLGDIEHVVVVL